MMLFHTNVLGHPTARALYAGLLELDNCSVGIPPTVAEQLAPTSASAINTHANLAEQLLRQHRIHGSMHSAERLAEESWWWSVWKNGGSPYGIPPYDREHAGRVTRLLDEIDPRGFPGCPPNEIRNNPEARIVCETIALDAWLCLQTDMRVIDYVEINRWAKEAGHRNKDTADMLLYDADQSMVGWTYKPAGIEWLLQAGMLACWPDNDNAPAADVLRNTRRHIGAMTLGGTLPASGQRLLNGLRTHPDPIGLVEETRKVLPSATVEAERRHPRRHPAPPVPGQPPTPRTRHEFEIDETGDIAAREHDRE
ncbi:MAG: hypothetical protein OXQ28_08220 [Acidobacteriota bacterium]|nr:hypothetical protein [Acidobacteriota bacterium]